MPTQLPFTLTKAEVRVLVEFSKIKAHDGEPWTVLFQPNVKGRSRVVSTDGFTLAVLFGPPLAEEWGSFGIPHRSLAALYRSIPTNGTLRVGAKSGKRLAFAVDSKQGRIQKFGDTVIEGTCPRDPDPKLARNNENLEQYLKALPRTRYEKMLDEPKARGFDPKFLARLTLVAKAHVSPKRYCAVEWCLVGDEIDPVLFVLRGEGDIEKWRVAIMPMRL